MNRIFLFFTFLLLLHSSPSIETDKYYLIQQNFISLIRIIEQEKNPQKSQELFQNIENLNSNSLALKNFAQVITHFLKYGFEYEETTTGLIKIPLRDKAIYLVNQDNKWVFTRYSLQQHKQLIQALQYFQTPKKTINFFLKNFQQANYQTLQNSFAPLANRSKESPQQFKKTISKQNIEKFYTILKYHTKEQNTELQIDEQQTIIPYHLKEGKTIYFIKINNDWLFSPETRKSIPSLHQQLSQSSFLGPFYYKSKWLILTILIIIALLTQIIVLKLSQKINDIRLRKKIRRTFIILIYLLITYPFIQSLAFSQELKQYLILFLNFIIIIFTSRLAILAVDFLVNLSLSISLPNQKYRNFTNIISKFFKFIILVLTFLIIVSQAGINITSLLAGIGIGGLAFALAAKDTIENIFGSFTILFDAPFSIGDYIQVNDIEGTVEDIGLRSIKIRTFYGSFISLPNSNIIRAKINNFSKRPSRRVKTSLAITYGTSTKKIKAFCSGIEDIIKAHPLTNKERFFVFFNEFADSSLNILLYFFIETTEWGIELRERQVIFLNIIELAEQLGVEFAFPTQTVHLFNS